MSLKRLSHNDSCGSLGEEYTLCMFEVTDLEKGNKCEHVKLNLRQRVKGRNIVSQIAPKSKGQVQN